MKFKIGDKVRCINNDGVHPRYNMKIGAIYTVKNTIVSQDFSEIAYRFHEIVGDWFAFRFELANKTAIESHLPEWF